MDLNDDPANDSDDDEVDRYRSWSHVPPTADNAEDTDGEAFEEATEHVHFEDEEEADEEVGTEDAAQDDDGEPRDDETALRTANDVAMQS